MRLSKGFTLIEIMITLAVLGILTSVAYPSYQYYLKRSHSVALTTLISGQKTLIEEYAVVKLTLPKSELIPFKEKLTLGNVEASVQSSHRNVKGVVSQTSFIVLVNDGGYREIIQYTAELYKEGSGLIEWGCYSQAVDLELG